MARKVFVTSDMSHDERLLDVAESDAQAALLWPWLLTAFDDWGRAHAEPRRLKVQVFPGNPSVDVRVIARSLALLHDNALISVWEHDGRAYMAVDNTTWFRWQTHIRKEKRDDDAGSKFPKPSDQVFSVDEGRPARFPAHLRELARENTPSPSPSLTPSAASSEFQTFLQRRAELEVESRIRRGVAVSSRDGLIHHLMTEAEDFIASAAEVWKHRDCERCGGKGEYDSDYAPGAGVRKVKCDGV